MLDQRIRRLEKKFSLLETNAKIEHICVTPIDPKTHEPIDFEGKIIVVPSGSCECKELHKIMRQKNNDL